MYWVCNALHHVITLSAVKFLLVTGIARIHFDPVMPELCAFKNK